MITFILEILNKVDNNNKSITIIHSITFTLLYIMSFAELNKISASKIVYPNFSEILNWIFSSDFIALFTWGVVLMITLRILSYVWLEIVCNVSYVQKKYLYYKFKIVKGMKYKIIPSEIYDKIILKIKYDVFEKVGKEKGNITKVNLICCELVITIFFTLFNQELFFKIISFIVVIVLVLVILSNTFRQIEWNIANV